MKPKYVVWLMLILFLTPFGTAAAQTGQEFVDKGTGFKLALMGDWKAVTYDDAVGRQKSEFVYRDRSEGLLKVSKMSKNGRSLQEFAEQEDQNMRVYRRGYERSASEIFGGGALRGVRLSFYNTDGGRQLAGTYYFLEDGDSVWLLRFTGKRGSVDTIRNVTDQIARSFRPL